MDIKTLESFKLSDAIKYHYDLNPKLWRGNRLDPAVKKQLLLIAKDFIMELGIKDLDVDDVTISGSNAAYTYTPHSDLDLHILVDMSKLPNDEVYQELFRAKKTLYNDSHDIKIRGVPVELYVQDKNQPVISLGEYSLLKNSWIKIPKKQRANFDQRASRAKYDKLNDLVKKALLSKKSEQVDKALKIIKQYRQAGLDKGGEFSPENLAFKAIRKQGYIQDLYSLRDKLHSRELSIENIYVKEDYHPNAKPRGSEYEKDNVITEEAWLDQLVKDLKDKDLQESASGYIPNKKQKNDPRFKTALTIDVKPNSIKKNAKAFGFDISRAGMPPTLPTNGKTV